MLSVLRRPRGLPRLLWPALTCVLCQSACLPDYEPFTQRDLMAGPKVGDYRLHRRAPSDRALSRRVSRGPNWGYLPIERIDDHWVRLHGDGPSLASQLPAATSDFRVRPGSVRPGGPRTSLFGVTFEISHSA